MDVENYQDLMPIILLGIVFFISALGMFYWSSKRGQLARF
jgi:nitrogen fixation-related uncharacterized protein